MGGVELCQLCLPCHGRSFLRRAFLNSLHLSGSFFCLHMSYELSFPVFPHDKSDGEQSHGMTIQFFEKPTLEAPWKHLGISKNFQVSAQVVDKLVELVKSVGASEAPRAPRRWRRIRLDAMSFTRHLPRIHISCFIFLFTNELFQEIDR